MAVYISLLRGINVSGQKKIRMEELKKLYESLHFTNVLTYIQSGNVIFSCNDTKKAELSGKIERKIKQKFGFDVEVLIKTPEELRNIIDKNPFDEAKLFLTFLFGVPQEIPWDEINKELKKSEKFDILEDVVYFFCPDSYGRTKLSNNFFEAKLKVSATTRNWKTVNKLLELVEQ